MSALIIPRLVGLCGFPKSGKTTVAELLALLYGAELVDDGKILRDACASLYRAPMTDFTTQEGKAASRKVCGISFTNRQLLGDLGNLLEGFYGQQFMPEQAIESIDFSRNVPFFVFPSVRKTQGLSYVSSKHGGIVVEVRRTGCKAENDFDQYDTKYVNYTINNNGDLDQLTDQVTTLFYNIMGGK